MRAFRSFIRLPGLSGVAGVAGIRRNLNASVIYDVWFGVVLLQELEINLNGYKLITLNSDNSIGIYNPLVINLMGLIPLKT